MLCLKSLSLFQAHLNFPSDYPYSPPTVKFLGKVWHPNVYEVSFETLSTRCFYTFSPNLSKVSEARKRVIVHLFMVDFVDCLMH